MRKKFLAQLLEQMAPLTTDQEGRLHGGFCSLNACGDCDLNTNANCDCPSSGKSGEKRTNANCDCPAPIRKDSKGRTNTNCDCGCAVPSGDDTFNLIF